MAMAAHDLVRDLAQRGQADIIDAHFAYPDGYAAMLLGKWLDLPVTITLRGTETRLAKYPALRKQLRAALAGAARIFTVSSSLRRLALDLGADGAKVEVVGNGVDTDRFRRLDKMQARRELGLPHDAPVLCSVGGLVERKGFHRVISLLPSLSRRWPGLCYLVAGGPSPEGDIRSRLEAQIDELHLRECVQLLGPVSPDRLATLLSAADVFVLATRNEGWPNVFLEAMACGLPVVTTDVGGNREVVCRPSLGIVVPFDDGGALEKAIDQSLRQDWDHVEIRRYAESCSWEGRVDLLVARFRSLHAHRSSDASDEAGHSA
jgi:glycosyltransferase involved in cell wall biosynthesis